MPILLTTRTAVTMIRSGTLLLTLCVFALYLTSSASAATYSVYACEGPGGQPLPNSAWLTSVENPSQTTSFTFGAICGDLSVGASTADSFQMGDGGEYVFDPPTGTSISGYALTRSAALEFPSASENPRLSVGVRETMISDTLDRDCNWTDVSCSVPSGQVERSGLFLTSLSVGVHCVQAPGGCPAGSFASASASLASARVDVDDPTPPEIVAIGGTLPGSSAIAGPQTLNATATDVGGGVAGVELTVDGMSPKIVSPGGSCGQPYTLRQPCPSGILAPFLINTAELVNGLHIGSVRAVDAAGNVGDSETFMFAVTAGGKDQGSISPNNGSPAVERPVVRNDKSVISSRNGKSVLVEGTLTTEQGQPISGATLDVRSTDLGVFNAAERAIGTITTTPAGHFSVRVTPHGARRITINFRPTPASLGTAVSSTIVREDLALSVKPSKKRVRARGLLTLAGRLTGAGDAAKGAPVEIDVRIGGKWRAVGVVEANSKGVWKWRYRFSRVTQPTRFVFRALVRKNRSWPWPTEIGKSVRVVVA